MGSYSEPCAVQQKRGRGVAGAKGLIGLRANRVYGGIHLGVQVPSTQVRGIWGDI